jgi:putative cell wall-binding protein
VLVRALLCAAVAVAAFGQLACPAAAKAAEPSIAANPTLVRYAGANRFATAAAISTATFADPSTADVVYIAYAYNFPDALAGAAAAGTVHGPILLADAAGPLNASTVAELERLQPSTIVVLGSASVISDTVATDLGTYAPTVVRYGGLDRFATAAAISAATFTDPAGVDAVYIANAYNFPDALAAAAAAGTVRGPVLLADATGDLNPATAAELERLQPSKIVVAGGPSVVSAAVETALGAYAPSVVRYAGTSRFATAAAISAATFPNPASVDVVYLAYAFNFPDALAGAAAAGTVHGPILLADTTRSLDAATVAELQRLKPSTIVVLGGLSVLSQVPATEALACAWPTLGSPLPAYFRNWMPTAGQPKDAAGVVMTNYGGSVGRQYNPTSIGQAALAYYNRWLVDTNAGLKAADKAAFLTQTRWLVSHQEPDGRWLFWFKWGGQPIPWWSGMAEGVGMSALLRAYSITDDPTFLAAVFRARTTFERDTGNQGVAGYVFLGSKKYLVYEEYLHGYAQNVLNGWIFGLAGLYDAATYLADPMASNDLNKPDRGFAALKALLPYYDMGNWSLYNVTSTEGGGSGFVAKVTYHQLHIGQLRWVASITGDSYFSGYADRFQAYLNACTAAGGCPPGY